MEGKMKIKLHKLTSLAMAFFTTLEIIMSSFYSTAAEENKETDTDSYTISIPKDDQGVDKYGPDGQSEISLKLATMVDEKNLDSQEKISFAPRTVKIPKT